MSKNIKLNYKSTYITIIKLSVLEAVLKKLLIISGTLLKIWFFIYSKNHIKNAANVIF